MAQRYAQKPRYIGASEKSEEISVRKKRSLKPVYKFLIGIVASLFIVFTGVYCVFSYYYGLMSHTPLNPFNPSAILPSVSSSSSSSRPSSTDATVSFSSHSSSTVPGHSSVADTGDPEVNEYLEQLRLNAEESDIPISSEQAVLNILLIGYDCYGGTSSRSDSMIVASINTRTGQLFLTSILRDSYVYIPGYGYERINVAFAAGGPSLLIDTIRVNYKIQIDRYAAVDFLAFIDLVDAVGGVPAYVSVNEINTMDCYISEINEALGRDTYTDFLYGDSGDRWLNGVQTLAYCRDRYDGTDFARTQRQRTVLSTILNMAKQLSISQFASLANSIFPRINTDISQGEFASLLINAFTYMSYNIVTASLPVEGSYDDLWVGPALVIKVNMEPNVSYFKNVVYG